MNYTSAQANKLLKKLQDERKQIISVEKQSRTFVAATIEDVESARPPYDYAQTQERLRALEDRIRTIKHCINAFNTTQVVEGFGMTVDQMLIYIPQLSDRKEKLAGMAAVLEKKRYEYSSHTNIIEYEYANYDIEQVKRDHEETSEELARAQLALDRLNTEVTMYIPD